jgi:hypothetical protein
MYNYFEYISYIAVVLALYGSYLNSNKNLKGFYYWFASNWWFVIFNIHYHHYAAAILNGMYQVLTIYGWYNWKYKKEYGEGNG